MQTQQATPAIAPIPQSDPMQSELIHIRSYVEARNVRCGLLVEDIPGRWVLFAMLHTVPSEKTICIGCHPAQTC